MSAHRLEPSSPEGGPSRVEMDLYPDLVRAGGLSAAMLELGSEHALEIGEVASQPFGGQIKPVLVQSGNGSVSVVAGVVKRLFSIGISRGGHLLANGATDSLIDIVRLADAWRKGIAFSALEEQFPFMNVDQLAKAFEDGNQVAFRWGELLRDPDLGEVRSLLMAVQSNWALRGLFPSVSHLTLLRLDLDSTDSAAGAILIGKTADLGFTVDATWIEGAANHVASIEEALEVATLLLRDRV